MEVQKSNKNNGSDNLQVDIQSYIFSSSHRLRDRCRDVYLQVLLPLFLYVYFFGLPSLLRSPIYRIAWNIGGL